MKPSDNTTVLLLKKGVDLPGFDTTWNILRNDERLEAGGFKSKKEARDFAKANGYTLTESK